MKAEIKKNYMSSNYKIFEKRTLLKEWSNSFYASVMALVLVSVLSTGALAQHTQTVWLGGSLGFRSSSQGDVDQTESFAGPEVGYFISESRAVGGVLNISSSTTETEGNNTTVKVSDNATGAGLFFRQYKYLGDRTGIFGNLGAGYFSGKSTTETTTGNTTTTTESTFNGFQISLKPGIQYWVYDSFSIVATVGDLSYQSRTDTENDTDTKSSEFNLVFDLNQLGFSLLYHF